MAGKSNKKVILTGERIVEETGKLKQASARLQESVGNLTREFGGGQKKVDKIILDSPEMQLASRQFDRAANAKILTNKKVRLAKKKQAEIIDRPVSPSRSLAYKKASETRLLLKEEVDKALKEYDKALNNFLNVKSLVTADALRRVRNKGIRRLFILGGIGALGAGAFPIFFSEDSSEDTEGANANNNSLYRFDPNNGWLEYNKETGQYEDQLQGFGIDRFGNTNYYDGLNWLTPDLYILGSNGYIYDKASGLYIGTVDDMLEAHNNGYNNIFDYRATQAGYNSPEAIKQLQTKLGVTADGIWGLLTLNAYNMATYGGGSQYDPYSLVAMYQRKMLLGW